MEYLIFLPPRSFEVVLPHLLTGGNSKSFPGKNQSFSGLRNHFSAGIKGFAVRKTRFSALGNGFSAVRNNGKVNKYERLRCEDVSRRGEQILLYEHRSLLSRSLRLVTNNIPALLLLSQKKDVKAYAENVSVRLRTYYAVLTLV